MSSFVCDEPSTDTCPCCRGGLAQVRQDVADIMQLQRTELQPYAAQALEAALAEIRDTGASMLSAFGTDGAAAPEACLSDFDQAVIRFDRVLAGLAANVPTQECPAGMLEQPAVLAIAFRRLARDAGEYIATLRAT